MPISDKISLTSSWMVTVTKLLMTRKKKKRKYEKVIKKSNKRSLAWEFFEFRGKSLKEGPIEKEVYCNLCSCKVPYNSSTSNLLDHVRRKHESELIEAEKKSKEANKPKSDIRKFVISDSSNNNLESQKNCNKA